MNGELIAVEGVEEGELAEALAVERRRAAQLATAVCSNRRIGIAVGLVMAQKGLSDADSLEVLRRASMDTNRKLAALVEDVIARRRLA